MQRRLIVATVLTAIGVSSAGIAMAAGSETAGETGNSEIQMFQAAKVTLDQASQIAMKEVPGRLIALGFNDENGKGVYEATILGADGQASIVKIDADSGAVLGKGLAGYFDDEDEGAHDDDSDDSGADDEDNESEEG